MGAWREIGVGTGREIGHEVGVGTGRDIGVVAGLTIGVAGCSIG